MGRFLSVQKIFLLKDLFDESILPFTKLKENMITKVDSNIEKYDCILGKKYSLENYKLSKIVKHHLIHFC